MTNEDQISFVFGPFRLNASERRLVRGDKPVPLAPKVFDTLVVLVENGGRLVDKDELMRRLWPDSFVEEATLARNISDLRKVLGESSGEAKYIETVPKSGYRFVATVTKRGGEGTTLVLERRTRSRVIVQEEIAGSLSIRSMAVLPLKLLKADDTGEDYLGLGVADALITRFSKIRRIRVRPTSAIAPYSGLSCDPVATGRELGVDSVLEGNIQRIGDRMRVTVQLVSVYDGASLWGEKFDERFTDIFAVEDSISEQVARALVLELTAAERSLLRKRYTDNPAAYQLYLKGQHFWYKGTEEGMKTGIQYFQQAIEEDAAYAAAYHGLSDAYMLLAVRGIVQPKEALRKAKAAAKKALEIDDTLGEAHASLAHVRLHDWDWTGLEEAFDRAIVLNPAGASAYNYYAEYLWVVKRFDEAITKMDQAREIDPLSPLIAENVALALYQARRYDEAIEEIQAAFDRDPKQFWPHFRVGRVYVQKRMYEQAITELETAVSLSQRSAETLGWLGHVYAAAGMKDKAQEVLDELTELAAERYVSPYSVALVYAGLVEKDQAFEWLEAAFQEQNPILIALNTEPGFDSIRADARYRDLLLRIGFVS
jgi:DNA-binding winged helix-turn-helix (wHTH) protein/tetratricopeptide (TPR) repeat protein